MDWFNDLEKQLKETATMMDGAISSMGKVFEPKAGVDSSDYQGEAADLMINLCKTLKGINASRESLTEYAKKFKEIEQAKKQMTSGEKKAKDKKEKKEKKTAGSGGKPEGQPA